MQALKTSRHFSAPARASTHPARTLLIKEWPSGIVLSFFLLCLLTLYVYFAGGVYFFRCFAIALFKFFSTFFGSLPDPRVLLASPRHICFLVDTSYMSRLSVPILIVELVV